MYETYEKSYGRSLTKFDKGLKKAPGTDEVVIIEQHFS